MLWSGTLWDLRQSMIALDPAAGLADFDRLIVESLASTPCQPTLLDGRDAILAADTLLFSSANHAIIWNVFAARGMGVSASTIDENDEDPVTDYGVPSAQQCTGPQTPDAPTVAVDGENRIRLDFSASDAAAVEIWRDDLDNPADSAVRVDFTTETTNYLDTTVQGGKSYRYHVVALGQAGVVCRSGPSATADITATGECAAEFPLFIPELTVTDGDPGCAVTLAWNAAMPACPGAAESIVYNIYRSDSTMQDLRGFTPGFMPSDRLLIGRTDDTTFVDAPPDLDERVWWFDSAPYYLVLAQHGTLEDAPDHRDRGASQVMDWEPGLPTLGRTTKFFWDFDNGPQGWTSQDLWGIPPENHWALADPSETFWGGTLLAPDEAAGGSGMAWVTGDAAGGPSNVTSHNCEELQLLNSPRWDATDGSTILSFDYWAHSGDELYASLFFNFIPGSGGAGTPRDLGMLTTQRFLGPARYGWQRFEVDLSRDGLPSTDSWVQLGGADCSKLAEFGIDNVRIEQAVVCSRSWLRLDDVTVDDTQPAWGNGNGRLEPGEVARLIPALRNDGSSIALAPSGHVYSRVPGVSILDATASFPDIPSDAVASATADDFLVALPMDAACDGTVIFEFVFTDQGGQRTTAVFAPEWGELVTDPLLEDDFETDQAWEATGASPGQGRWERGRPRGTLHGASLANPDSDSPGDDGTQCFVTGNQGLTAFDDDVDPGVSPRLTSPPIAVNGYKRVYFDFDLWGYTSSAQDELDYRLITDANPWLVYETTRSAGNFEWEPKRLTIDVNPWILGEQDLRLTFLATDNGTDDVVEYGVDNVRIAGEYQFCDTSAILPPNAVGDTLTLSKTGSTVNFNWGVPSADASHDPAVYFKLHGSDRPMDGFSSIEASTLPSVGISALSSSRYFIISAHNGGGSSGEEPAP
jgi:hypothetical protein